MSDPNQDKEPETVLVVDDEENVRQVLSWALGEAGYRVVFAANGEEAISLLMENEGKIDFVVSDVQMPVKNGVEVLKFISTMEKAPQVVMISAHSDLNYTQARAMGAANLVAKPFSIGVLITALREAAANSKKVS
ncbi:MAG: response regulator [Bdellovibrionaceae bacterium]|nr:response regulator [Bdellovibrionales bacterium]MCB9083540.1 response regulator [Pseudobdellovibrionaceae bacterium]